MTAINTFRNISRKLRLLGAYRQDIVVRRVLALLDKVHGQKVPIASQTPPPAVYELNSDTFYFLKHRIP